MKKSSARILKILTILLMVCAALYGIALALATHSLRQAYAELEASGRPMTLEEVEPEPVPSAQNAAPLYQAARMLLQAEPMGDVNMMSHLQGLISLKEGDPRISDVMESELRDAFQQEVCVEALRLIEKGSTRQWCRFNGKAPQNLSPLCIEKKYDDFHLSRLVFLGQMLNAHAQLQMADGDSAGAWETTKISLQYANSFSNTHTTNPQFLRQALAAFGVETIQNLCSISIPDSKQIEELLPLLRALDDPAALARSIDVERIVLETIHLSGTPERVKALDSTDSHGYPMFLRLIQIKPFLRSNFAYLLQYQLRLAQDFEQAGTAYNPQANTYFQQAPFYNILIKFYFPIYQGFLKRTCKRIVNLRITSAGLAALQYHREHGTFPESLAKLDGLNVIDPFTGEALGYRVEPDGFILSSPGPEDGPDDDIIWHYQIPTTTPIPTAA